MSQLEIHEMFMPQLNRQRTIRIWLPDGYKKDTRHRYPVLYMHDGQNLFEKHTAAYGEIWDVQGAMHKLMQEHIFRGGIVVGIDNARSVKRMDEYSPWVNENVDELGSHHPMGGEGEAYARFIVETLKPQVDARYRTLPNRRHTGVAGSSMGGFISLYMGARYPHIFSMVGAFSTAVWFKEDALHESLRSMDLRYPVRWYLDVGTKETSNPKISDFDRVYVQGTKDVRAQLLEIGVPESSIRMVIEDGAIHNEKDWARRLPNALRWLFQLH